MIILVSDRAILTGTTSSGYSGSGNNGNKEILYIPQSFRPEASLSDGLAEYPEHSLG